ncbi:MAG: hypothetical protein U9P38_02310, partial [Campylobacterota bacterium]|nr:hypothetical protein [Campylobacterota bacterium]
MRQIFLLTLLTLSLSAKTITPNEVYSQVMLISDEIHFLLKHYGVKHDHEGIITRTTVLTKLKPRNVWQITYEIMVKINIFREGYNLPTIEPVNMTPVLQLNPDLVYEQTQRILTELQIFKVRNNIKSPQFKIEKFKGKTPLDVYNGLTHISFSFDELNGGRFSPSYVFGEQMRVYGDITLILQHLKIEDKTIPKGKNRDARPEDVFDESMKVLEKIKQLQIGAGIDFINFREFKKGSESVGEVYTITQMILAELQTIKAYIGIEMITPAATKYNTKTSVEVKQL